MNQIHQNAKRIFLAIDIPKTVGQLMPMIKSVVDTHMGEIRWLSGYHLHLTLSFLGNVPQSNVEQLCQTFRSTDLPGSFRLSIEKTGLFPDIQMPRVLWLGIARGADELSHLQKVVDNTAAEYKEVPGAERFVPHVTIGRIGKKVRSDRIDFTQFNNTEYEPIVFRVRQLVLYESQLLQDGPRYTAIEKFPLK